MNYLNWCIDLCYLSLLNYLLMSKCSTTLHLLHLLIFCALPHIACCQSSLISTPTCRGRWAEYLGRIPTHPFNQPGWLKGCVDPGRHEGSVRQVLEVHLIHNSSFLQYPTSGMEAAHRHVQCGSTWCLLSQSLQRSITISSCPVIESAACPTPGIAF